MLKLLKVDLSTLDIYTGFGLKNKAYTNSFNELEGSGFLG